eukprot:2962018-Amphidinium_carterae.2
MEEITCYVRPRRASSTSSTTCENHETYVERQYAESYRIHQDVPVLERRNLRQNLQLLAVSDGITNEYEDDVAYTEHSG